MTISSPNSPAITEAAGLKTQLMARLNLSRRIARLTCQRRNPRLKANAGIAVCGNRQRVERENVRLDLPQRTCRRRQLPERPAQIGLGRGRRSVADGIDPQHAILARHQPHQMRLRQRIAAPVVAETEHVSAPQRVGCDGRGGFLDHYVSSCHFFIQLQPPQPQSEGDVQSSSLTRNSSLWLCGSLAVYFAVDELTRPHFEIDQRPEPL